MQQPFTPTIEIHLAHDEEAMDQLEIQPLRSPYSPKFPSPMAHSDSAADDFRPVHLMPPPSVSPRPVPKLSSAQLPVDKKGIDQERFAQLLRNCRDRSTTKHGRKDSLELRKQVALKVHNTKALERRALFLSKIQSPPSPGAANSPVTPPESPAVFHFTLPSPGMQSPLAVFESLSKNADETTESSIGFPSDAETQEVPRKGWVEEVDFRARVRCNSLRKGSSPVAELDLATPHRKTVQKHSRRASGGAVLPSLDQITARLTKSGHLHAPPEAEIPASISAVGGTKGPNGITRPRLNLPIHRRCPSSPSATTPVQSTPVSDLDVPSAPPRVPTPPSQAAPTSNRLPSFLQKREVVEGPKDLPPLVINAPGSSPAPKATTRTDRSGSIVLSAPPPGRRRPSNPLPPQLAPSAPFTPRAIPTLLPFYPPPSTPASPETRKQRGQDMVERLRRRSSAPAALPPIANKGTHRVLRMKGGF